jgi:hypothetical protein
MDNKDNDKKGCNAYIGEGNPNEKATDGIASEVCLFVPDTFIIDEMAAAEAEEARQEKLWREELAAAGLDTGEEGGGDGQDETDSASMKLHGVKRPRSVTVVLPDSDAPKQPKEGMNALEKLWGMATEMWYDYKLGRIKWGHLATSRYTDRWNVGARPVMHYAEMLLQDTPPDLDSVRRMVELLALHRRTLPSRADRLNAVTDINELRRANAEWTETIGRTRKKEKQWSEASAVNFLKSRGYMVMKSMRGSMFF